MKALEYEAVNQTDHEDATDPAGQSTKKRHRTLLWTAMTNGPPMIQRQSQYSYTAVLLISTLVVILMSMHGRRTGKDDAHKTGMLLVTPELIQSEHGTISSAFFAPSSPEDTTCPDATLEISKNNHVYGCISDRLQNNEVLGRGTVLCSEGGRYSFGFAKSSNALVWRDCRDGSEREYYRCPSPKDCAFVLSKDGAFTILTEGDLSQNNMGKVVYKKLSNIYVDAGESSNECLDEPRYDCPYIHLHSSGKLVLHYIDEKGAFKQKVTNKVYSFDYSYFSREALRSS